jgi:hypothetical protein
MAPLVAGSKARVVDSTPEDGVTGNRLRQWPVTTAIQTGLVGVGGIVTLLHGSFTDEKGGVWWVVRVEKDTANPSDVGKVGWMAQITPGTGEVNLM